MAAISPSFLVWVTHPVVTAVPAKDVAALLGALGATAAGVGGLAVGGTTAGVVELAIQCVEGDGSSTWRVVIANLLRAGVAVVAAWGSGVAAGAAGAIGAAGVAFCVAGGVAVVVVMLGGVVYSVACHVHVKRVEAIVEALLLARSSDGDKGAGVLQDAKKVARAAGVSYADLTREIRKRMEKCFTSEARELWELLVALEEAWKPTRGEL